MSLFETNFLIGHAKGEAPDAFEFLSQARKVSAETEFVIPEICLMEAFHALEDPAAKPRPRFQVV